MSLPMKRKITLKDIAKNLGFSISTVSKALNDSHEISKETKRKIITYAKENKYHPNINAVSLRKDQSRTLGVIIPNILNYFFAQVFSGIEKVANDRGYSLISCISNESYEKEVATTKMLRNGLVSGLLISLSEETEKFKNVSHLETITNTGIPIVMFDRVTEQIECDKVVIDDMVGAYNATDHLVRSGCKKIALISLIDNLELGKLRIEGYKKCLSDHQIAINEKLIIKIFDKDFFEYEIKTLLSNHDVDAILGLEEYAAVNAMLIAKSLGYRIPDDISIIGFTNGVLPKYVTPTITSVSQHGKFIGEKATQLLIDRIEGTRESLPKYTTKVIKTNIIERDSTK